MGSESSFNPLRMMFNNGYGILSANTRNNDITAINYSTGLENSWDNITSLVLSGRKRYRALLNIYPGILHVGNISPGIFGALNKKNEATVGVSFSFLPVAISFSQ